MKSLRNVTPSSSKDTSESKVENYMDMSESELLNALHQSVQKSKENGTFSIEKIRASINLIAPKLSAEQLEKLEKIMGQIN